MKKFIIPVLSFVALMGTTRTEAQNNTPLKQGRVVYQQLSKGGKSTVTVNGVKQVFDRPDRTQKIELLFTADQSLRRFVEEEDRPETEMAGPGGMGTVRFVSTFSPDVAVYHNFTAGKKVEQRESAGKKFLIQDSITKNNWKLTGETKTILGYTCQKAITQATFKSFNMQMTDGEMKRTEKVDTMNVIVWFTPAISIPAGPEYQGQLPGLILETESRNGSVVCTAVEISPNVKVEEIKEPKSGKKITKAEYEKEVDELQKQMMERGSMPARTRF